ncbi:MAG: hypothetical protein B7Y99_08240 [Caulobacterales bacterium 32-69-10]|nr:MAG: hypothetical protein B7Y99_08240 [Caulobacterales bacterium 32-69-10]
MGPAYWAGLTFGAVCIFLGLVLGLWGARIVPSDPASRAPVPAVLPQEPTARDAGPSSAPAPSPAPIPIPTPPPPAPAPSPPAAAEPAAEPQVADDPVAAAQTAALEARLAEAEAAQKGTAQAASAALAVSALAQAAAGSRPFAQQVDEAARVLPASDDLAALRDLAAVGAPSRPVLAAAFPAAAARAAVAARQPGAKAGLMDRAAYFVSGMITVRRTDRLTGPGADAILARAGRAADAGDLDVALREIATLSPAARAAIGPWRADAERRLAIERRIATLRAGAAASLKGTGG